MDCHLAHPSKVYIIAEIGINHNGNIETAKNLIDVATNSGAHAVKFQKRVVSESFTEAKLNEPYTSPNSWGETYGAHKRYLEFSEDEFRELRDYAKGRIEFGCTAWDQASFDFLSTLDLDFYKISSGDLTNFPLIEYIASRLENKPLVMSTGMSDLQTVIRSVTLVSRYTRKIAILSCCSTYPSPYEDINLNTIETLMCTFPNYNIGYSGHEIGYIPSLVAVGKNVTIIERHITLDRNSKGSDHSASLEPNELKELCDYVKIAYISLGSYRKRIRPSEKKYQAKLCKSLCSTRDLKEGERITEDMITVKHPATGISPMRYKEILGLRLLRNVPKDTILTDWDLTLSPI